MPLLVGSGEKVVPDHLEVVGNLKRKQSSRIYADYYDFATRETEDRKTTRLQGTYYYLLLCSNIVNAVVSSYLNGRTEQK